MGMFDTVWLDCPHCGGDTSVQSKAGDCHLSDYSLKDAPQEILDDIEGSHYCDECSEQFNINLKTVVVKLPYITK